MKQKSLFIIFLIVFIDLLGFSLILPLLPFYAESFGATPIQIGLLVASYAAAQFIGAPILGRFSDRFGRRPVLMISIFGSFIGFLLLGFAGTLWVLFTARLLDGFTGGNISVAQAYITDITNEKNRARGLGLIGAAFGLGFIIGPAIGGVLSEFGYAVPALFAAGFSILAFLGATVFLQESLDPETRLTLSKKNSDEFRLKNYLNNLSRPRVGPLLNIRFFYSLAFSTFQTIFPLYALYHLELSARNTGFVLTYVGVLVVFVQGFLVSKISNRFRDNRIIFTSLFILMFSLFAWAFVPSVAALLIILIPLAFSTGTLNTVLNSALSKSVTPEEVGGTLGISASLESLTRVISPSTGGWLLGSLGTWAPGVFSGIIMIFTVGYAYRRLISQTEIHPQTSQELIQETVRNSSE